MNELFMEIKEKLPAALGKRTRFLLPPGDHTRNAGAERPGCYARGVFTDAFTLLMLLCNPERADWTKLH